MIAPPLHPVAYLKADAACPWVSLQSPRDGGSAILYHHSDQAGAEAAAYCAASGLPWPQTAEGLDDLLYRLAEHRQVAINAWLPPDPVPAAWLLDLLSRWDCSQPQAAKLLRMADCRTVRRWCAGSAPIPWAAAFALQAILDADGADFLRRAHQ